MIFQQVLWKGHEPLKLLWYFVSTSLPSCALVSKWKMNSCYVWLTLRPANS